MDNQDITFVMHTPEGDVTMYVLFTFHSEETKANYMLFTPDKPDSGKPVSLSACRYDPEDLTKILPLKGELDKKVVQSFINYLATASGEDLEKLRPKN